MGWQSIVEKVDVKQDASAKIVVTLMDIPQPWILSTDRTEWSFGTTRFNILMLGVVHDGVAYPLLWEMLDKKGNSDSDERMNLLDRFQKNFPNWTLDKQHNDSRNKLANLSVKNGSRIS